MQFNDQLHVLTQSVRRIAASGNYNIFFKQTKGTGDNQVAVECIHNGFAGDGLAAGV